MRVLGRRVAVFVAWIPNLCYSQQDVAIVPVSSQGSHPTKFTYWETSNGETAYLVVTNEAWSVVDPGLGWSMYNGTCLQQKRRGKRPRLATTQAQARANNCDVVATNGGPYNKDGTSSGPLVLKGQLQTNNTQSSFVGIGLAINQSDVAMSKQMNNSGYLEHTLKSSKWSSFLCGNL